jgi:aminoglycoside 3-N-acetyltransferase
MRRSGKRLKVQAGRHWTRDEIRRDVEKLGVRRGDVLLVHSALSRLGFVEGGADAVIGALLDTLGNEGTLLMPSFPFDTFVAEYLAKNPCFDVRHTPSRMGKITEVFRTRDGVVRSLHPTHPVAALGPAAEEITSAHHRGPKTFGEQSPFYRLCDKGGKVLLMGVDFHAMTNLHVVEDVFPGFPYLTYLPGPILVRVTDESGRELEMATRVHDPTLSRLRDCNKLEPHFLEAGVLARGKIGDAEARLMPARGVLEVMTRLAERGITMYFDDRVPPERKR